MSKSKSPDRKTRKIKKAKRNSDLDKEISKSGIYDDENPPHLEAKNYINDLLAQNVPKDGKLIVLDGTHFRTSRALNLPLRTIIPQFNYDHYEQMIQEETFGHCVQYEQLAILLRQMEDPIGLLYADICGSMKEMQSILGEISKKTFTKDAIVACTICARDGEKKDSNTLEFTTELLLELYNTLKGKWNVIGETSRIKYGNMCTYILKKED